MLNRVFHVKHSNAAFRCMKGTNTMTKSVSMIQSEAAKLATLVKDNSPLDQLIVAEIGHREELKVSAVKFCIAVQSDEALLAKLSSGELPEPDSGPEGNNPDLYEESKGNGKAKRVGSFWGDWALSFPTVRKWVTYKRELEEAFKKGERDPVHEKLWKKGENWGKAEKAMIAQRITAAQNLARNGMRILFKIARIHEEFDGITVDFEKDDNGNVKRTKSPIILWQTPEKGKLPEIYYMSQGEFLALNLDKAKELGGSITALVKSGQRGAAPSSTVPDIQSVKTFLDTCVGFYAFSQNANNTTKLVNHLIKDENADDVKYVAEVYLYLDTILKAYPKIRKAFDKATGQATDDETKVA